MTPSDLNAQLRLVVGNLKRVPSGELLKYKRKSKESEIQRRGGKKHTSVEHNFKSF